MKYIKVNESPMEELREQVSALTVKVDVLSEKIDYLTHQLSEILSETSFNPTESMNRSAQRESVGRYQYRDRNHRSSAMQHKDVLADDNYLNQGSHNTNKQLSPELQIQRLTAQLTAAYNRIAALEEQLLSHRMH